MDLNEPVLQEAIRELDAAIHDARVAFDCIGLGEIDRAHTSAVTARTAIDAAVTAIQAVMLRSAVNNAGGKAGRDTDAAPPYAPSFFRDT